MRCQSVLSAAALFALARAIPVPLNINLGAYSPAVVVGDGEISFGGAESVERTVNTLQGAAVNNAGTVAAAAVSAPILSDPTASLPVPGVSKELDPREGDVEPREDGHAKRDLAGFDRALTYAEAALVKGPKIQLGTGVEGSGVGIIIDNQPSVATTRATRGIVAA
ncbi:hypothetical protein B0T26DRAFT_699967 [Lasiosphaeria miniovina]|uniref:Uncharacterized protein n=1 Tax=Lasiosphaeria miniovina TaxID=1954250 RepID=A0AA40ATH4_9PEZI|nr:uncharacterized protein B0T26DRAFT_699967 [Lasiosphaeria miniovina]KAK0721661.1 hypothetical protein B0T26DRAFT_699967 [Lasiosphaeria miniovina]